MIYKKFKFYLNSFRRFFREKFSVPNNTAIFIVGNQKTGSTVIAHLLAIATQKSLAYDFIKETHTYARNVLLSDGAGFNHLIRQHRYSFSRDIIKELNFIFYIEEVFICFPQGQFVIIIRDPRDNIRSILNRLNLPGNLERLQPEQLDCIASHAWRDILEGSVFKIPGQTYIEVLANRWNHIIEKYEKHEDKMYLVRYEDFVKDKIGFIRDLSKHLGINPKQDISSEVNRQYQPKGDHSITWIDFFGKTNLRKIETICGSGMLKYGYESTPNK